MTKEKQKHNLECGLKISDYFKFDFDEFCFYLVGNDDIYIYFEECDRIDYITAWYRRNYDIDHYYDEHAMIIEEIPSNTELFSLFSQFGDIYTYDRLFALCQFTLYIDGNAYNGYYSGGKIYLLDSKRETSAFLKVYKIINSANHKHVVPIDNVIKAYKLTFGDSRLYQRLLRAKYYKQELLKRI